MRASENLFGFESSQPTVGIGIAPIQHTLADYTAGRELHPALKTSYFIATKIPQRRLLVKAEQMCYTIFIPVLTR